MFNIITVEHFKDNIQQYGNHKEMLRSLKSIRYCKLEAYSDSLEGILRIPKKESSREPLVCFGFHMSRQQRTKVLHGKIQ